MAAIDHTLSGVGSNGHEQFGPHRTSRALGIIHLAIFEAVNTIYGSYESYHGIRGKIPDALGSALPGFDLANTSPSNTTTDTAIVEASHDAMVALYPKKKGVIDFMEATSLQSLGNGTDPLQMDDAHKRGYYIGKAAAKLVLMDRGYDEMTTSSSLTSTFSDGSSEPEPSADDARYAGDGPDRWHPDPIHPLGLTALGGNWMDVKPFTLSSASAARPMAVPLKSSKRFISAYKDVKQLGGDPTPAQQAPRHTTATARSSEQTVIGGFWAYDATALLCAPPRLYNEIAISIALKEKPIKHVAEMARFLALVNIAMADAGISAWDAKYAFRLGRPVTYIRALAADATTVGASDTQWTPLGAPVSNGTIDARNLTPPFPSYPSGHAVFGGAVFEMFRLFWATNGTDEQFSFMSDEFNGSNYGPGETNPRPAVTKVFKNFHDAEKENARSRIFLGIHWRSSTQM